MSHPFFRPQEVHAEALILVGYRLYPYTRVEFHPRLTLLAGGNGVGKTTLLDAVQTILIADQRALHLNVAAGQNDRDLGGQMQDRIAWAVLHLKGHGDVSAIGVLLSRRAAAEYVDLKPFALTGTAPEQEFFVDRNAGQVVSNLKALNGKVKAFSPSARVKEFSSVSDYHRFLHEEGLLPIDLSRAGKRHFSLLWRQATQPHLGELNKFLQQTLCHEPEKRLTFEDVEKLMQERLHTERQLHQIEELKALHTELQTRAQELDHHRRHHLGIQLGLAKSREESLCRDMEEGEKRFQLLDERMKALRSDLDKIRSRLDALGKERDKHLREQGEWSRRYKHYKEYTENRRLMDKLHGDLASVQEVLLPLEPEARRIRENMERLRQEMQLLSNDLARKKQQESALEREVLKWREFQKDLERTGAVLGRELNSFADLEHAWQEVTEARKNTQQIRPLRQLHHQWASRSQAYNTARELAQKAVDLWPDLFAGRLPDQELLEEAQARLRAHEKRITLRREELLKERGPLKARIKELSKGRPPLPKAAADLVERGLALPFTRHFDTLSLDAARECQEMIGPFSRAIEPVVPGQSSNETMGANDVPVAENSENARSERNAALSKLVLGDEPFWLILSQDVWKDFRILQKNEQGVIAGLGNIAWYTPKGPVWIGAEARREQIQQAQNRLMEIEGELRDLSDQEEMIAKRRRAIQDLLPKLESLNDSASPEKAKELAEALLHLEQTAPRVERLYPMVQRLLQRSELFDFVQSPEKIEKLKAEIKETAGRYAQMETSLKTLKNEEGRCLREAAALKEKSDLLRRELDKSRTLCSRLEEEEPEEVLQGRVDFGRSEELVERIGELDRERERIQNELFLGERKSGELRNRYRGQSEMLAKLKLELGHVRNEHERALDLWRRYYPAHEPQYLFGFRVDDRERHKAVWDNLAQTLRVRLTEVAGRYDLRLPHDEQPDRVAPQILQLLLPPGLELEQLETQCLLLQQELQQIEQKIKSHVEEIRSSVEKEIRQLRIRMARVNRILSTLNFGQIKRISLELVELPIYHALKKLESFVRVISKNEALPLREFVGRLRALMQKEANVSLSEEQIADYRSYVRIRRVIMDRNGDIREGGLSSGETLGVNLALCLAILFFLGREHGVNGERGMLLLALDEAERLDARALETIRDLLDDVRCQLLVAMPRPVDIPDSLCHLLTPLSQGVTHVHLYHKGEAESAAG